MESKYNKNTSIRLDPEIKGWLYTRCNKENRSLSNLINTVLKDEKQRDEKDKNISDNINELSAYLDRI